MNTRSSTPDFSFSPSLGPGEAYVVRLYREIDNFQWWSPEAIKQRQFSLLAELLKHARKHVPFYADMLREFRIGTDNRFNLDSWTALPLLTKAQIRSEAARLKSPYLEPSVKRDVSRTSGSTGVPLEIQICSTQLAVFAALKLRMLHWHGCDMHGKLLQILPPRADHQPGTVQRFPSWEWPFGTLFKTGELLKADIFASAGAQLDIIEREAPQHLLTQPSNLRMLLNAMRRSRRRFPSLKLVRTQAEQLDPDLREECREVLGLSLVDNYGASEGCGFIAVQCPEHDHYHVQSEQNLVEVLKDNGEACKRGEVGRVVITPLHSFAMPLLRCDMGDYAEVGAPCPCGRGLPVLRRIYGREKELLTLPSGERRYSTFASRIFSTMPAVAQFQIAQKSLTDIEARIVAERPLTKEECDRILEGLAKQVGPEFALSLSFLDHIPRLAGGKYMEFVSEMETTAV